MDDISYYLTFGLFFVIETCLRRSFGERTTESVLLGLQSACSSPRNPLGQVVFLTIYGGCVYGVVNQIFPHTGVINRSVAVFWFAAIFLLYTIVCRSNPGRVDDTNQVLLIGLFRPDGVLRVEKFCDTCMRLRPAQGKHHDGHCIAYYDHHCIWVRNSIGFFNMRYFLLFLTVTSLACAHGAMVGIFLVYVDMISRGWDVSTYTYRLVFRILANEYAALSALIAFLSICSSVLFLFLISQVWQIMQGITTYESIKMRAMDPSVRRRYRNGLQAAHLWFVLRPYYHLEQKRKAM